MVRRHFHRSVITVALLAIATAAAAQQVTLEALLSAPFPSEISAAPAGGHVAWVANHKGSRNVWIASAPDFNPRQLTTYSGDDGQEITSLTWTHDGKTIVFVRGGGANRAGEIPNPAITPQPAEQAIYAVDVAAGGTTEVVPSDRRTRGTTSGVPSAGATTSAVPGAGATTPAVPSTEGTTFVVPPRKLANGSSPTVSRSGQVAYLVRGQVWSTNAAGTEKPAQLFTIRGGAGALRWSPNGTTLAFVSGRGTHSFIGAYDVAAKSLRYLDPSIDLDNNPSWSPDGRRIVFTRVPATRQNFSFAPRREAVPWSIRVVDVASGKASEVWKAEPGAGSVFQGVNTRQQLMWAAGDRIVFPWEREGWIHLYSVPVAGGKATPLTPGAFEVEHVALAPDRTRLIYSSNARTDAADADEIERRHLWSVSVDGSARPIAMTRGTGAEWMPEPIDANTVAFIRSDGRQPAQPALVRTTPQGAGEVRALVTPQGFPASQLVEPQRVTFTATDGMEISGQLFVPRDLKPGERRPAVLFFHGGSRRQMLLAWHYLSYYHNTYAMNQYLASRGYIVLSVNYRSGTGYGLNFREALNYGATGASEFQDVMGAGLYMKSRPDVDPKRIGIYGGSYGGYLTAHALARASDLFAAGVDIHGVHDWNVGIRTFIPSYNPGPEIERRNFQSSPLNFIEGWRSPVLLIHGDDDRNVSFVETVTLAEALRKQGVTFESLVIPDEIHGFLRYDSWRRVFQASADFFDRYLKGKSATSTQ